MEKQQGARVEKIRPAKACNTCRRKKVKCDGKRPTCSSCIIFKLPCGFEDTGTKTSRPSREYVEDLEQRVKRMDDELQRLRQNEKSPQQSGHYITLHQPTTDRPENAVPDHFETRKRGECTFPPGNEPSQAGLDTSDQPSYVLRTQDGKMRFFGASSGFGVHRNQASRTPKGNQSKLDREHAARYNATQWPLTNWIPRILQDTFDHRAAQPLPSKDDTMSLVSEFLSSFNRTIPLVDEISLMRLVERQFSWNPDDSPSSWILLNVVMAFSYRERAQEPTDVSNNWQKSLGHVKNAMNVVVDLFMRNADLSAVQGLLGLAIYFQGTPNAQALFMFAASAMRLAHSIGLHRNTTSGFTLAEIEERRRTFWISFILDADISLRVGRPPAQDMDDYNTPLPAESPHDGRGIISINGTSINFFRQLAQFATVQRLIYRHLQTSAVIQQPKEVAFKSAKACEEALLQWKTPILDIFEPEKIFNSEPNNSREHILRLNLAYHCCYANLRQMPLVTSSVNDSSNESQSEVDKGVAELCVRSFDSARSALSLLPYVRLLASDYRWNVLYFFATAAVALSSEIHTHPTHRNSHRDLSMIGEATKFLANVSFEEPGTFVDFILSVCSDLERSARYAIHQSQHDAIDPEATDLNENASNEDSAMPGQQQPTVYPDQSVFSEVDLLTDNNPELFNAQWSVPPFWNLQDMFIGMPSSSN
ncbi:unnamed protein product [Penicillium pancosmium]